MSEAHKFVTVRRGNCPLVLTAPHGGTSSYLNSKEVLEERPDKPGVCKLSDLKTMELLHSIDEHIAIETGGLRPHIVALRCHRKYIDANRNYRVEADAAFHAECRLAKDIYTLYHESIEKAIEVASAGSPQGRVLHLDIHGMKPYADYIVAGTRNNTTCDRELAEKEYTGFLYHLREQFGAQVVLPAREGGDVARYKGGYTVQRHGDGGTGGRCDAIQLEFGAFLRLKRQREEVARNVATAASNTLLPMHSFLRALLHKHGTHVYWDERATERVITKLKRIHCFAPNDLRNKMKKRGVTSINSALRFLGEIPFKKTTIAAMSNMLGVVSDVPLSSLVPLTRKEQRGAVAGAEGSTTTILCSSGSNVGVVRRIFFYRGDEEGLEFVRRVMDENKSGGSVGSGSNDDDNAASTGDTGATDEEMGALLSSTVFLVPPATGTGADVSTTVSNDWNKEVSAEQGMLRPLGPCGQPIVCIVGTEQQQQEGDKDGDGDGDEQQQQQQQQQRQQGSGTCLTLPGKSTFGALFKEWRRKFVDSRENKRLSLQNISLGGAGGAASTHVVAWVSAETHHMSQQRGEWREE